MNLTKEIKKQAAKVGFVCVGITSTQMLLQLPRGWIDNVINLHAPEEELADVNSVILLGHFTWDKSFNIAVDSTYLNQHMDYTPKVPLERYQLYYEILKNKAWSIVDYLRKKGHKAQLSLTISLKTSAVECGLGSQGKNTLLITPKYGPRIRLIAILTTAKLDLDEPFQDDLCGDCEKCITACPTQAIKPYEINIRRCLTYAAEAPNSKDVPDDVREIEKKLTQRPTANSYVECIICQEACPIGRLVKSKKLSRPELNSHSLLCSK